MGADKRQYDYRGTKSSWRQWKRELKRSLVRAKRRESKILLDDTPKRITMGWSS